MEVLEPSQAKPDSWLAHASLTNMPHSQSAHSTAKQAGLTEGLPATPSPSQSRARPRAPATALSHAAGQHWPLPRELKTTSAGRALKTTSAGPSHPATSREATAGSAQKHACNREKDAATRRAACHNTAMSRLRQPKQCCLEGPLQKVLYSAMHCTARTEAHRCVSTCHEHNASCIPDRSSQLYSSRRTTHACSTRWR